MPPPYPGLGELLPPFPPAPTVIGYVCADTGKAEAPNGAGPAE